MRIMALVSWWGTYVGNPFWGIGLAGMHARLVARLAPCVSCTRITA